MREIKFRGKAKLDGKWWFGNLVPKDTRGNTQINNPEHGGCFDIDPDTVGQFTGLHDKNLKDIYEGDIVKMSTAEFGDEIYRIGYEDSHIGAFSLCADGQEDTCRFVGIFGRDYGYEPFYCEVIGNIYDNPQLLKGGKS